MLPVFFDHENNEYARPKDLVISNHQMNRNSSPNTNNNKFNVTTNCTAKKNKKNEYSVNSRPPSTPSSPVPIQQNSINIPPTTQTLVAPTKSNPPPQSVMEYHIPEIPQMDTQTFPSLVPSRPSSANSVRKKKLFSPKMSSENVRVNRVMRIVSQKSANYSSNIVTER